MPHHCASIWIATRTAVIAKLPIKRDYSYGVYLYGWPAEQIAYSVLRGDNPVPAWQVSLLGMAIALLLAARFQRRPG